jgi:hypothetical protein
MEHHNAVGVHERSERLGDSARHVGDACCHCCPSLEHACACDGQRIWSVYCHV